MPAPPRKRNAKDSNRKVKKKVCIFCKEKAAWVDYKDVNLLRKFMSDRGKIRARRVTGNCSQHQRDVAVAIKTARELALLPYTMRTMSESRGGRGGPGGGGGRGPRPGPGVPDLGATSPDLAADIDELDEDEDVDVDVDVAGGDDEVAVGTGDDGGDEA
jgi:small subunit ribosomal protein S18